MGHKAKFCHIKEVAQDSGNECLALTVYTANYSPCKARIQPIPSLNVDPDETRQARPSHRKTSEDDSSCDKPLVSENHRQRKREPTATGRMAPTSAIKNGCDNGPKMTPLELSELVPYYKKYNRRAKRTNIWAPGVSI